MASFNPDSALLYRWNYSWDEIIKLYTRMQKIYLERREVDYEFIVKIASACMGGKSEEGTYDLDDGEGLDEMTNEQEAAMRAALGEDYDKIFRLEEE